MNCFIIIFILFFSLWSENLYSIDYYIKTNGANTNTGTSWETAWQTLQYAADRMAGNDTAHVSNGIYHEQVDITNKISLSFLAVSPRVQLNGKWMTNYSFRIKDCRDIVIRDFDVCFNRKAMIFLTNSHSCVISNNRIHENNNAYDEGAGIRLIDSHRNRIRRNTLSSLEAPASYGQCYGISLYHSHTNSIISNEVMNSGSGAEAGGVDIWCHGIYILNSSHNLVQYNYCHDMDHYGIHVQADNTKGAPYSYLANRILDNTIAGMEQAILTHTTYPQSIPESLQGQAIGRNTIQNVAKGIIWDSVSSSAPGQGGWIYKNSITSKKTNYNIFEAVQLINSSKVNFSYNSISGFYYGLSYYNSGYCITNIAIGSNYNLNMVQKGGSGAQSLNYSSTQSGKVGTGILSGPGNVNGEPSYTGRYETRLKWNSACIGSASPGPGGVRGCMGAHTSFLRARDETASNITAYTLVFVTSPFDGTLPDNARISAAFPPDFSFSAPAVESHNLGGSLTPSFSGSTITFTRSGGSAFPAGQPLRIVFTGVQNPYYIYDGHSCVITTMSNNDTLIEKEDSNDFRTINAAHRLIVTTNRPVSRTNMDLFNNLVMRLYVLDTEIHALDSFKVGNAGTMVQGTDISKVKVWQDVNESGEWDTDDVLVAELPWTGSFWSNSSLGLAINYPGQHLLVTADYTNSVRDTVYFKAYVPAKGITCTGATNGPATSLTNRGECWFRINFRFPPFYFTTYRASCTALGDVNNDGYVDFVVGGNNNPGGSAKRVDLFISNGDGTFTGVNIAAGLIDRGGIVLGDVDNDGDLDLLYTGEHGSNGGGVPIYLYLNDGSGNFTLTRTVGSRLMECSLALCDVDNDTDLDLIACGYRSGVGNVLEIYYNLDGKGGFSSPVNFGVPVSYCKVACGDLDNDGDQDIIVAGSTRLDLYENPGNGRFSFPRQLDTMGNYCSVAIGDINDDGWLDLVATSDSSTYKVTSYINDRDPAISFTSRHFGVQNSQGAVLLGDIDNDGDLDFITLGHSGVYANYNDGSGNFQYFYMGMYAGNDGYCSSGGLGDFDGDNDLDLVLNGNTGGNASYVFFNIHSRLNTPPPTPVNLTENNVDYYWQFQWEPDPASDDHTSDLMLRYNLAVGTNSGVYTYLSTALNMPAGQANLGNIAYAPGCSYLTRIPVYKKAYWKVCSIDTSFKPSDYSLERTASIVGSGPYYVATNGDDSNNGSITNPFRTIQRAVNVMSGGPPVCGLPWCYVFPGTYREQVTIRSNRNPLYMLITALSNSKPPVVTGNSALTAGFTVTNTSRIRISGFVIYSNTACGIRIAGTGTNVRFCRNLVRHNPVNIEISGSCRDTELFNNTIFRSTTGNGVLWKDTSGGNMLNNILLSNTSYGVRRNSTSAVVLDYNDFFGNTSGPTSGGFSLVRRNWTNSPLLETVTGFTITSPFSYALDTGTNIVNVSDTYNGYGPDMGWKESDLGRYQTGPFYVDVTNGLDEYPGSREAPFRTIQRAANRVSSGTNITIATCYVLPGIYRENVLFSGNNNAGKFMVFRAYDTNKAPQLVGKDLYYDYGFRLNNTRRVILDSFSIGYYSGSGIYLTGTSQSNLFLRNDIWTNEYCGIYIYSGGNYNRINRNRIRGGGTYGILIYDGDYNKVTRNAVYRNTSVGIYPYEGALDTDIYNNTVVGNGHSGIYSVNSYTTNICNNILLSNARYGVEKNGGLVKADVNTMYGNGLGPWNGTLDRAVNNIINLDPLIETVTSFTIVSVMSPCVDTGLIITNVSDQYRGAGPDMGWKESVYSNLPLNWAHILPMDQWTRTIYDALQLATNNCLIECYPKPGGFAETVLISGFTNLILRAFSWTNSRNNTNTVIEADGMNEGIRIDNSQRVTVQGFTVRNANNYGIRITTVSSNNTIRNTRILSNGSEGIYIDNDAADNTSIISNIIFNNSDCGIYSLNADNCLIAYNVIYRLSGQNWGIYIDSGNVSRLYGNIVYRNGYDGIHIQGVSASN
ncbi:MAG: right-handed parallel beta-helix repeat-containing protein, partial [bacterium]|nr:right-handed parallel beta-helix repeat-containing protein [bacterium]